MRYLLMSVGEHKFFDEPTKGGLIGGKVVAVNLETGEETSKIYRKYHTGKTDKFGVLAQLIAEVAPPPPPEEEQEVEKEEEEFAQQWGEREVDI